MKIKYLYYFGTLLLFLGLLWMFLPHTAHDIILNESEQSSHLFHTFEGAFIAIVGIVIMVISNKLENKNK